MSGGKREGAGRKHAEEPRSARINVRLTPAEFLKFQDLGGANWIRERISGDCVSDVHKTLRAYMTLGEYLHVLLESSEVFQKHTADALTLDMELLEFSRYLHCKNKKERSLLLQVVAIADSLIALRAMNEIAP